MHKYKKSIILVILLAGILALLLLLPYQISYDVYSKGLIIPAHEWSLKRTIDGNLISSYTDNIKGAVNSYGVTEFQRGDVVEFKLNPAIYNTLSVKKGDTIGIIYSNEEERRLIQLQGQYEILKAELTFWTTGKKPEDVQEAERRLLLLQQKLETQKRLMERTEALYQDSLISHQKYELELNELRVQELSEKVAEAQFRSAITGDKPERAELIMAKIKALEDQIDKIKDRLSYFTLISPVSGMVVLNKGLDNTELLINIVDTSAYAVIIPVELTERSYLKTNDKVEVKLRNSSQKPEGQIINIDNVVQVVDGRQSFFVTAKIRNHESLVPGIFSEIKIKSSEVTPLEYTKRMLGFIMSR